MAKINPVLTLYHNDNRYFKIFNGSPELDVKRAHVENVLNNIYILLNTLHPKEVNTDLLLLCAEHHDDGRVDQFKLLGKFLDTEVSHQSLGVDRFYRWLQSSSLVSPVSTRQIQIFVDVMLFHGRIEYCSNDISKRYISLVTAADDLENATSCLSYLIREIKTDAKGYRMANPEADQRRVSKFVFDHFRKGVKFDKIKYCHTYGEYVLSAGTLMTSCIQKYRFAKELLQKPGYGYASILEGYKEIFELTLAPRVAEAAYKVLEDYSK